MYFAKHPFVPCCLLIVICCVYGRVRNEKATYKLTLDVNEKFNVSWTFTGLEGKDTITFTVEAETTGWVGLGFSPQGSMAGADIIVAWVDNDGKAYLQDMMAESKGLPDLDEQKNVNLISASESNGKTTVTFSRQIDTCDSQDRLLKMDTTRLIYAYSSNDPQGESLTSSQYHGPDTRGSKSVYLFDPQSPIADLPEDALTYEVVAPSTEVPSTDTTYYCSFHEAPPLTTKHHLIASVPIITAGNEGLVHHMILYACWNVTQEHMRTANRTDGICYSAEMPEFASSCRSVVFGWAVGGGSSAYPEGTGYPIGGKGSPEYFLLEMHYDNPAMRSGMVDSSGARLVYTPVLRDIDVGSLSLGATIGLVIPPLTSNFTVTTYCHSSCTNEWIPEGGITVFSYLLHAHLLGAKLQLDVYRRDGTVEVFAVDNSYDFNFQETRLFQTPKKLYPGDGLKLTCTMDSSNRDFLTLQPHIVMGEGQDTLHIIVSMMYVENEKGNEYSGFQCPKGLGVKGVKDKGGESTREEMCFAFINYYPRTNASHCGAIPGYLFNASSDLYTQLNIEPIMDEYAEYQVDLHASFENTSWNIELKNKAQRAVLTTPHLDLCTRADGQQFGENPFSFFAVSEYSKVATIDEERYCTTSSATRLFTMYSLAIFTFFISVLLRPTLL